MGRDTFRFNRRGVLVTSSQQDLIHRADSAGLHFFTIPSPAEGSTNSTWPRDGQAKVTRVLVFFWTSGGGRHEAASGVHPPFGCVQMRESEREREAEAQFAVLTFLICSLVESQRRGHWVG